MEPERPERSDGRGALRAALVFLSCLAADDAGHALHLSIAPTLILPAAGIALAAAYLGGIESLAAIFFAEFVFAFFALGYAAPVALALGAFSALQAGVAITLLRRFAFHTGLARLRDAYLLIAIILACSAIVPTFSIALKLGTGLLPLSAVRSAWGNWYVGEIFSLLIVTPFLFRWLPKLSFTRSRREWFEIALVQGAIVLFSFLIFATPYGVIGSVPLIYLLLLPLFWVALRLGPRMMTLSLFLTAAIAITGSLARFPSATLASSLFSIELLIIVLAIIFLVIVTIAEERRAATATLRRQLLRLEVALENIRGQDKAKNDFIALLAHELRNPLAPLLSSLELVRLTEASAATRAAVNAMRGRVRTMARLLDDLFDLSRIEHRTLSLTKEPVDLRAIAARAIETAEPLWEKKRQHFEAHLPTEPVEVFGDPVRLEQVVVNLLTNANKYTDEGGHVTLSVAREGAEATLEVADNGAGIALDMLERIFRPFAQGEPGLRVGGLGIGLALSKELVVMHSGTIEARSAGTDQGSAFTVRLPLEQGRKLHSHSRSRALKHLAPTSPLRLLIVDDNRAAADTLAALLTHLGHTVTVAYDGESGIRKVKREWPAAAILDIGLPDLSGYEVAKRLKESGSDVSLIALTGFGQAEDKRRAFDAGFSYHLVKPVGLADLEPVLRAIAKKNGSS
ncbi:MAG: ATP-binding protein [Minisyncoccia bacterium]